MTHTFTSLMRRLLIPLTLALGLSVAAYAAGTDTFLYVMNNTTLAAAMTATQTTVSLTSASALTNSTFGAVAVGQAIFVDAELMNITATTGTSTIFVVRRDPRHPAPHVSGAQVWIASPSAFKGADPPMTRGAQTDCTKFPVPWINVTNGNVWECYGGTAGVLAVTNAMPITFNSTPAGMPR